MKKIISGILVGAMTLSMAGMVFADQVQTVNKTRLNKVGFTQEQRQEKMKEIFDQVVEKGIINQDQMDKLLENRLMNLTPEERKVKMEERMKEAVKSGKMTQEKADTILEKMKNGKYDLHEGRRPNKGNKEDMKKLTPEERKAKMEERMKEAVKSGKMTQEKADTILEKMENGKYDLREGMRPHKGNKEDMKKLTQEERKAKMEERMKEAVKSGKMTQEQADKMLERAKNGHTFRMKRSPEGDILKKGVEEGIVTQEQADKSMKIINENRTK